MPLPDIKELPLVADGVSPVRIIDVPAGAPCSVHLLEEGGSMLLLSVAVIDDGEVTMVFDVPGTYRISMEIENPPEPLFAPLIWRTDIHVDAA